MRDPDIRNALIPTIQYSGRILQEVCVNRSVADIIVVSDFLHGYEIKSEYDSLSRLQHQSRCYAHVCSYMTAVVAPRHVDGVKKLPNTWGIMTVDRCGLYEVRKPVENTDLCFVSLLYLLTKQEVLGILERRGLMRRGIKSLPRYELHPLIEGMLPIEEWRKEVCFSLYNR